MYLILILAKYNFATVQFPGSTKFLLSAGAPCSNCILKSLISTEFFLFFSRKFSQLHVLLEPPRLLISAQFATNIVFYVINIKNPTSLPLFKPRIFDFEHFSYLHVIKTPRLLDFRVVYLTKTIYMKTGLTIFLL